MRRPRPRSGRAPNRWYRENIDRFAHLVLRPGGPRVNAVLLYVSATSGVLIALVGSRSPLIAGAALPVAALVLAGRYVPHHMGRARRSGLRRGPLTVPFRYAAVGICSGPGLRDLAFVQRFQDLAALFEKARSGVPPVAIGLEPANR